MRVVVCEVTAQDTDYIHTIVVNTENTRKAQKVFLAWLEEHAIVPVAGTFRYKRVPLLVTT